MTRAQAGVATGAALAVVWIWLGFGAFILVALAMVIGWLVGLYLEGRLDVTGIAQAVRGRRRSS